MDSNLGAHDMGEVSLLGLDEFGEPVGPSAMWGALLGGGVSVGTAIGVRMVATPGGKVYDNAELLGAAAGVLVGGVLMAFKGTRHMGVGAALTAVVTSVPRVLEKYMNKDLKGLYGTSMERIPSLNGFGLTSMEQVPSLNGLSPQLLSAAQGSINNNPAVQGLPTELAAKLQGLARNYGTSSVG